MPENPITSPAPSRLERITVALAAGYAAGAYTGNHAMPPEIVAVTAITLAKRLIRMLDEEDIKNL